MGNYPFTLGKGYFTLIFRVMKKGNCQPCSKTNQTLQSNLNTIMEELQTIKHQMKYSATHTIKMHDNMGHHPPFMQHNPYKKTCLHLCQCNTICPNLFTTIHTIKNRPHDASQLKHPPNWLFCIKNIDHCLERTRA